MTTALGTVLRTACRRPRGARNRVHNVRAGCATGCTSNPDRVAHVPRNTHTTNAIRKRCRHACCKSVRKYMPRNMSAWHGYTSVCAPARSQHKRTSERAGPNMIPTPRGRRAKGGRRRCPEALPSQRRAAEPPAPSSRLHVALQPDNRSPASTAALGSMKLAKLTYQANAPTDIHHSTQCVGETTCQQTIGPLWVAAYGLGIACTDRNAANGAMPSSQFFETRIEQTRRRRRRAIPPCIVCEQNDIDEQCCSKMLGTKPPQL